MLCCNIQYIYIYIYIYGPEPVCAFIISFQEVDRFREFEEQLKLKGYSGIWKVRFLQLCNKDIHILSL